MTDRFPFEPLAVFCAARWRPNSEIAARCTDEVGKVAQVVGVDRRVVYRWRTRGIPYVTADEIGNRLGLHPGSIWPEWWAAA